MSLAQSTLKAKLKSELSALFNIIDSDTLDKACGAIAQAIVDEIQANAVVPSGIPVAVDTGTGIGSTTGDGSVQ